MKETRKYYKNTTKGSTLRNKGETVKSDYSSRLNLMKLIIAYERYIRQKKEMF